MSEDRKYKLCQWLIWVTVIFRVTGFLDMASYITSLGLIFGTFVLGNIGEHFANRGKNENVR